MALFVRGINKDFQITEEFLDLIPLHGRTTGLIFFNAFETVFNKAGLNGKDFAESQLIELIPWLVKK